MTIGIVVAIVVVVLVVAFISMYNGLVKLRNNRENAFANIDVQLKQRYDLVPQLVETIKGYASHEKETLEKYDAAVNEMHSLAELSAFRYGFSLGVQLMTESRSIQLTNENSTK